MIKLLSLAKAFILLKYKVAFEYKAAFWVATFSQILYYGIDVLLIWVLVTRFQNLGGWTVDEIMLLYSMQLLSYALAGTFFFGCCTFMGERIQSGQFDDSLIVPMHPLLYGVLNNFTTDYIRHFLLALVVFVISLIRLNVSFDVVKILMLILILLGSTLINAAALVFFSVPNFWMIMGGRVGDLFYYEAIPFIRYPITIFPLAIQGILTFLLPYAFINFYPAQYFLGKTDFSVFSPLFQYLTPLVGLTVFGGSLLFWNWGLKKYQSTGS
jgi:ABC-2 type transport system permease protein